jgi:hypothetical protein
MEFVEIMVMSRMFSLRAGASVVVCGASIAAAGCASQTASPPVSGAAPSQAISGSRLSGAYGNAATQVYNNDTDPLGGVLETPFVNVDPGMIPAGNKVNR